MRLWTLWLNEFIELACRTAGRNFTPAERAGYFSGQVYRKTCFNFPVDLPLVEDE